jgi:TetR/AcrR family transcriptional regulator
MEIIQEKMGRLSGEERRIQIIDAALEFFAEKGFNGTRTKEIAKRAGISETLIFQHFATKEALYRAVFEESIKHHPAIPGLEKNMKEKDDVGVFRTVALHLVEHSRHDPRIRRLSLFSALEGLRLRDSSEASPPLSESLSNYIQQRIEDGAFQKVNSQITARLFLEAILMYLFDQEVAITGPALPFTGEEAVETLVTVFLDGLKKT